MRLISTTAFNHVSGGNLEGLVSEACFNVTFEFSKAFYAAAGSSDVQTLIYNSFLPKIQEVCSANIVENAVKFAEFYLNG